MSGSGLVGVDGLFRQNMGIAEVRQLTVHGFFQLDAHQSQGVTTSEQVRNADLLSSPGLDELAYGMLGCVGQVEASGQLPGQVESPSSRWTGHEGG